jgi:CheY-like chemotaxis protein
MSHILLVADEPWVLDEISAALPDSEVTVVTDPREAADTWEETRPDAVLVDLQVASMGGMAVTRSLRDRAGTLGADVPPIVLLLDRDADAFLAGRAGATAWIRKPFGSFELRELVDRLGAPSTA